MKQDDKDFMELNRPHYTTLVMAGFVQNLTYDIKERWLNIIRENYATNYLCCLHCGADIAAMIKYIYTQYDMEPVIIPEPIKKKQIKKK
jgi:hypothetical protein